MDFSIRNMINTILRFGTLGVRFLFVFFMARYLTAASIGYYGIFTATISYALYCVGLDYYVYSTREILAVPNETRGLMIKGQASLVAIFYLALLPIAVLFLSKSHWPDHLSWFFIPILILEHLNQEVSRILIALSEQITASIILFVRQGSWAILAVIILSLKPDSRNLDVIMLLWAGCGLAAVTLGVWKLKQLRLGGWRDSIDWAWVKRGIGVSGTFLVATLALRAVQTVDRYWIKELVGIQIVGAYVLFVGIASALMVFLDAGVFSFIYPELIDHFNKNETSLFRSKVKQMFLYASALSASFAVASVLALPYLLEWIGKSVYENELYLYFWVLTAAILNVLAMVPHYALYARSLDRPIIFSHIAALPVFILSTWGLSYAHPALAVPIGVCLAFVLVLIWKSIAYFQILRKENRHNLAVQLQ